MTVYGYIRVSTNKDDLSRQEILLKKHGVKKIYQDVISEYPKKKDKKELNSNKYIPQFNELLSKLKEDDTLIISELSCVARNVKEFFALVLVLKEKKVNLISLHETWLNMNKNDPNSTLLLSLISSLNQFEKELLSQRTKIGLDAARARGRLGGRKPIKDEIIEKALALYSSRKYSLREISKILKISVATIYNYRNIEKNHKKEKIKKQDKLTMTNREEKEKKFRIKSNTFHITYPDCKVSLPTILAFLEAKSKIKNYVLGKHKSDTIHEHVHVLLIYETRKDIKNPFYFDMTFEEKTFHPNIKKIDKKDTDSVINYIRQESIEILSNCLTPQGKMECLEDILLNIKEKEGVESAIDYFFKTAF